MFFGKSLRRRSPIFIIFSFLMVLCVYRTAFPVAKLPSTTSSKPLPEIPRNIWQVFFGHSPFSRLGESVQSWVLSNQDYSYMLVSSQGADDFVKKHYSGRPRILRTFQDLRFPIFRADLLRYMLLEIEGGIYTDVDTTALKPIRDWIPPRFQQKTRAVVGIEYDQLNEKHPSHGFGERMSFCQWTLAASPGHSMMKRIVEAVVQALHDIAHEAGSTISALEVPDDQVGSVTGPGIWTRVVFESLSATTNTIVTHANITGLQEPTLFGDILILPIDGFGTGQPHSGSNPDNADSALVRHQWKMSWRHEWTN